MIELAATIIVLYVGFWVVIALINWIGILYDAITGLFTNRYWRSHNYTKPAEWTLPMYQDKQSSHDRDHDYDHDYPRRG
jgi:hypothetical protein